MRRRVHSGTRPVTIVVGCGEVGSAIAVALQRAGFAVVMIDEADPPWSRRGMAFTNAWYIGNSELDGEEAVFCASLRSIPTVLAGHGAIAATTWSWPGVAAALAPVALVDARARWQGPAAMLIPRIPEGLLAVGVGPGFVVGEHVHLAVETAPGERLGAVLREGATLQERQPAPLLGDAGRERFVYATGTGRFSTACRIGDRVGRGQFVGAVGSEPVLAPLSGVLRGLTARGGRVEPWNKLVEVDPRGDPALCFGIEERPRRIAQGVVVALRNSIEKPRVARA
jgi:xanthine dehydrogenase accessory factor